MATSSSTTINNRLRQSMRGGLGHIRIAASIGVMVILIVCFWWRLLADAVAKRLVVEKSEIKNGEPYVDAVSSRHWKRTVRVAVYATILLSALQVINVLWGDAPETTVGNVLLGLLVLCIFWGAYTISMDMKTLSRGLQGTTTRSIITVWFFSMITASLYIIYYTIVRGPNPARDYPLKTEDEETTSKTSNVEKSQKEEQESTLDSQQSESDTIDVKLDVSASDDTSSRTTTKKSPKSQRRKKPSNSTSGTEWSFLESPPSNDFDDIAGMEELKTELRAKVIEPLGNSTYAQLGVGVETGILLYGPPGTGKTHVARCLAGELGVNFAPVTTGDLAGPYVGMGVQLIRALFEEARQNQPALIFVDELDAIATARSSQSQHHDRRQMVSQLLQELSALDDEDIIVVGATNDPDAIDDAIVRTGRFDSKINVPKPDLETRAAIFTSHLPARYERVDPERFEKATRNLTSSDMVRAADSAAWRAARRIMHTEGPVLITEEDMFDAIEDVRSNQRQLGEFVTRPPATGFKAVAGMDALKTRLRELVIEPLENPQEYEQFGLSVETGILLYGPPGTGKTHVTRCLAGELGINYVECRASDLVSKFVGEGAKNIDHLFREATQHSPCLVFLDELDALAADRTRTQQTQSQRQMVNQFLQELSRLHTEDETVVVIGATNRPDDIDTAILRTGRFNEKIEVPPPDRETRIQILQSHLDAPTGALDFEQIAHRTQEFVASDMAQLATEAARHALRRSRESEMTPKVTQQDVEAAIRRLESPGPTQASNQGVVTN